MLLLVDGGSGYLSDIAEKKIAKKVFFAITRVSVERTALGQLVGGRFHHRDSRFAMTDMSQSTEIVNRKKDAAK